MIFVRDIQGKRLPSSAVTSISCSDGVCKYQIFHFEDKRFETVLKETIAEAEQRAQERALSIK